MLKIKNHITYDHKIITLITSGMRNKMKNNQPNQKQKTETIKKTLKREKRYRGIYYQGKTFGL